jgi:hypothetical protein
MLSSFLPTSTREGPSVGGPQPNNSGKYDGFGSLTDEELMWIAAKAVKETEQENGKGHVSNSQ